MPHLRINLESRAFVAQELIEEGYEVGIRKWRCGHGGPCPYSLAKAFGKPVWLTNMALPRDNSDGMFFLTSVGLLAGVVSCLSSLLLIGTGVWVLRRIKLPCLPWVLACWGVNFPLVFWLNSWCLNYLVGRSGGVSLSGIGLFSKRDAMRQFMGWHSFFSSIGGLAVVLLVVADVTFLACQLKSDSNDQMPRAFWLVRRFAPAFGLCALVLAVANHCLSLLVEHISP